MDILWWALLKILIAEGKWKFSTHLSILTKSPSFPERNFDLAKFLKVRMDRLVVVAFFVLLEEKFLVKNCHLTGIWHFYNVWRRFTIFTIPSEALKVPLTKVFWPVIWEKFLFFYLDINIKRWIIFYFVSSFILAFLNGYAVVNIFSDVRHFFYKILSLWVVHVAQSHLRRLVTVKSINMDSFETVWSIKSLP